MIKTRHPEEDGDEYGTLEDERGADDGLFQERLLLQERIFAHCEYLPRRVLQGPLLDKADWCALRTVACRGSALVSVLET